MVNHIPSRAPRVPRAQTAADIRQRALKLITERYKSGLVSESGTWKVRVTNKHVILGATLRGNIAVSSADIIAVYEDGRPARPYGQVGITVSNDGRGRLTMTTVTNPIGLPPIIETI